MVSSSSHASPISLDGFHLLMAFGWVDGGLGPEEQKFILEVAHQAGLSDAECDALRAEFDQKVEFEDVPGLPAAEARMVYGVATWMAHADGVIDSMENRAMVALGFILAVTPNQRASIEKTVEVLREGDFDLHALEAAIAA